MARLLRAFLGLVLASWLCGPLYAHHAIPDEEIQDAVDEMLVSIDSPHLDLDLNLTTGGTMMEVEITLPMDETEVMYDMDSDGTLDTVATSIDALSASLVDYVLELDTTTWSLSVTTADSDRDKSDDVYIVVLEFELTAN